MTRTSTVPTAPIADSPVWGTFAAPDAVTVPLEDVADRPVRATGIGLFQGPSLHEPRLHPFRKVFATEEDLLSYANDRVGGIRSRELDCEVTRG